MSMRVYTYNVLASGVIDDDYRQRWSSIVSQITPSANVNHKLGKLGIWDFIYLRFGIFLMDWRYEWMKEF